MHNQFKTAILLALLTGLLLSIGMILGGYTGIYIALAFAILLNFGSLWFSDKIVLLIYRAKPAPKGHVLIKMVHDVARKAGIPNPKVYIIPSKSPNAFATGRSPKHSSVAATQGIIELLSDKELEGVIAHEVAHIKNRDTLIATVTATIAGVIGFIASMTRWAAIFGGFGGRNNDGPGILEFIVLGIVTPIIAVLLQLAVSRSREYLADATGARITKEPKHLASALRKIHRAIMDEPLRFGTRETAFLFIANPFTMKGILSLLSTHPPMEERVRRLEAMQV